MVKRKLWSFFQIESKGIAKKNLITDMICCGLFSEEYPNNG